jgi:predicted transcriptional regulator
VRRERTEGVFVFRASVERAEVVGQQVEALVERMCGGSLQTLLTNLVQGRRLKPQELRELLDLVESLEKKRPEAPERK